MPDKPGTTGDAVQRSTGSRSATSGIARPSTVAMRILAAGEPMVREGLAEARARGWQDLESRFLNALAVIAATRSRTASTHNRR